MRTQTIGLGLTTLIAVSAGGGALAQTNIEKLKQMKVASADLNIPPVPQTGPNADAIRRNLERIKVPPGFKISLYAIVPDARHMAVAPSTNMLFVGTRKTTVWAVTNRNSGDVATEVKPFAPSLKFSVPNGVCWTKDGFLIVAEHNRILNFPAAEFFYEGPDVAVIEVAPQGKLIPVEEESYNHGARTCRVGKDGMLYVTLGQPHNVQPRDKLKLYDQTGIGGIVRMNPFDGSKREVYARGIRNSVGLEFNPKNNDLWFTDNQTDGMGDDIPAGELNRATKPGQFFGYPWIQGKTRITEHGYDKDPLPSNVTNPEVYMDAHAADLGLTFYTGKKFPAKYQGGIFLGSARFMESHNAHRRANHVHIAEGRRLGRQDRSLCRRLARPGNQAVSRSSGRCGQPARRLAAGQRRLCGRHLPHHVRRRCSVQGKVTR